MMDKQYLKRCLVLGFCTVLLLTNSLSMESRASVAETGIEVLEMEEDVAKGNIEAFSEGTDLIGNDGEKKEEKEDGKEKEEDSTRQRELTEDDEKENNSDDDELDNSQEKNDGEMDNETFFAFLSNMEIGESFANSDVEAFSGDIYRIDTYNDNQVYVANNYEPEYITDYPVSQMIVYDGYFYFLLSESGNKIIVQVHINNSTSMEIVTSQTEISRFAVSGNCLFYLTDETITAVNISDGSTVEILNLDGLHRFWLSEGNTIEYMIDDDYIHRFNLLTGEETVYENQKSDLGEIIPLVGSQTSDGIQLFSASYQSLKEKFPNGKYWNHVGGNNNPDGYTSSPCTHHDSCYVRVNGCECNYFDGKLQCQGFAAKLTMDYYGSSFGNWNVVYNLDSLKAGDVIRYLNNAHTIWVTAVDGDTVTYADCNGDKYGNTCIIGWDRTTYKSKISETLTRVYVAPSSLDASTIQPQNIGDDFYATIFTKQAGAADETGVFLANIGSGGNSANVSAVAYTNQAADNFSDPRQLWHFLRQSDRSYKIVNMYDGRCLDVAGGILTAGDGTNVQVWADNGGESQRWYVCDTNRGGGYYRLVPDTENLNFALDITGGVLSPGTNVQIYSQNDSPAQEFLIWKVSDQGLSIETLLASNPGEDFYARIGYNDAYFAALEIIIYGTGESAADIKATRTSDLSDPRQIWHFIRQQDGSYKIVNEYSGWCLDAQGGVAENGRNIWTWYIDHGGHSERWYLVNSPGEDTYRIVSALRYPGELYSIDIPNGNTAERTNVQLFQQADDMSQRMQRFSISQISSSTYKKPPKPAEPDNISAKTKSGITTVTWDAVETEGEYDEREYEIGISDEDGNLIEVARYLSQPEYTVSKSLPNGNYSVLVRAVNTKYWDYGSDYSRGSFTVRPEQKIILTDSDIVVASYSGVYDGIAHDAVASLNVKGNNALGAADINVSYSTDGKKTWSRTMPAITNAGKLDVWIKITGDAYNDWISGKPYQASVSPKELIPDMISGISAQDYTGTSITPNITVTDNGGSLVKGTDYNVAYANNINVGTASVSVTGIGNYTGTAVKSFTINKMAAEIVISPGYDSYSKTYGDAGFALEGITKTGDGTLSYAVTEGSDVVSVSAGTVSIKKAGTATVTVSMAETQNCSAAVSKTIVITVQKRSFTPVTINRRYSYMKGSDGKTVTIDIAGLLPADRGAVTYSLTGDAAPFISDAAVDSNGNLSYKVTADGSSGEQAKLVVTAVTDNYADAVVNVNITLTDRLPVEQKAGASVQIVGTNVLTYGSMLNSLPLNTGSAVFIDSAGQEVKGTLSWTQPDRVLESGTFMMEWKFIPTDSRYEACTGELAVIVRKAVPLLEAPKAGNTTYNPDRILADISLGGKSGTWTVGGVPAAVTGKWSWKTPSAVPTVNNRGYIAVFTPDDSANYEIVEMTTALSVSKATPVISGTLQTSAISYGQTLAGSAINGNANTSGVFSWADGNIKPTMVNDSDKTRYEIIFTPSDTANWNTVKATATVTVNKAENAPNMPGDSMSAANSCEKVGSITLPVGWRWKEDDLKTTLNVGVPVQATAVYMGSDVGNYERETVVITITRAIYEHDISYTEPVPNQGSFDSLDSFHLSEIDQEKTSQNQNIREDSQSTFSIGIPCIKGKSYKKGWQIIKDELEETINKNRESGQNASVTVDMNGTSIVPGDVWEIFRGHNLTVIFDMGSGIQWSVDGQGIIADMAGDIDFRVDMGASRIPGDIIDSVVHEKSYNEISLSCHDDFGLNAVLTVNLGIERAGLYAGLFGYDPAANGLIFMCTDTIDTSGNARFTFTCGADYIVVIEDEPLYELSAAGNMADDGAGISERVENVVNEEKNTEENRVDENSGTFRFWLIAGSLIVVLAILGIYLIVTKKRKPFSD